MEQITTNRLLLRPFTMRDVKAAFAILSDEKTNEFLPWFPARTEKDAESFLKERFSEKRFAYAICRKETNVPFGYIYISNDESRDLGYGLRSDFWNRGYATEAAAAVLQKAREAGFKYVTATHDRNNPQSGRVMQKAGMTYRYSYTEQWQPKDRSVVFRMYQINFDEGTFVYGKYREMYPHFIESDL